MKTPPRPPEPYMQKVTQNGEFWVTDVTLDQAPTVTRKFAVLAVKLRQRLSAVLWNTSDPVEHFAYKR